MIRLYGTVNDSIVDGPGLRYVVFTQGCPHHCKGCHNPNSHDLLGGYLVDMKDLLLEIDKNSLLDGITISGGEPFIQAKNLISFIKEIKKRHLHIMIYSGYTFEEIMSLGKDERELLSLCDTLVDGRFIQSQRSLSLRYKGSLNQRIINVSLSLQKRKIILQDVNEYGEFIINKS
ncbi:MAG: anaerobic ribonucleoside-triphosphate reductase activating protein [Coprobacillus sp.]|nr:anaerobic ribonucleoside-triphosphate reductase activating protein [Coprobacillus sp.]